MTVALVMKVLLGLAIGWVVLGLLSLGVVIWAMGCVVRGLLGPKP